MLSIRPDIADLYARLGQAVAWCITSAELNEPVSSLRTPALRPRTLPASRIDAVREVCSQRELALRHANPDADLRLGGLAGGRLLVYFPDADLTDGAAEAVTGGFFDVFNTPPWDTWVAYFEEPPASAPRYNAYVIAYIPPQFVQLAAEGIQVNPELCIRWLSDSDVLIAPRLAAFEARR